MTKRKGPIGRAENMSRSPSQSAPRSAVSSVAPACFVYVVCTEEKGPPIRPHPSIRTFSAFATDTRRVPSRGGATEQVAVPFDMTNSLRLQVSR